MKRPQFGVRTFFVLIAIAAIPMGWVAYQLNWIRQRRAFRARPDVHNFILSINEVADTP